MREGTSLDILSRNTDLESIFDKRSKSKSFSSTPVDSLAVLNRLATGFVNLLNSGVESPVIRKSGNLEAKLL